MSVAEGEQSSFALAGEDQTLWVVNVHVHGKEFAVSAGAIV